jgi:hypothetical protein
MALAGRLRDIVLADPGCAAALRLARDSGLPDCWLCAGAVYGAVWNALGGHPPGWGVNDYDLIYFDPDESWDAEDRAIRALVAHTPAGLPVQLRNQARVHLWFPDRFGFACPRLTHATQALRQYASVTHAVAARLEGEGLRVDAPFGLEAIFDRVYRPNPVLPNRATHEAKAAHVARCWPEVVIEPWPDEGPANENAPAVGAGASV